MPGPKKHAEELTECPESEGLRSALQINQTNDLCRESRLNEIISDLKNQLSSLKSQVDTLPLQTPESRNRDANHIPIPERFSGEPLELRGFLSQLGPFLRSRSVEFQSEEDRVDLLLSLLSGSARTWAAPFIEGNHPILDDFEAGLKCRITPPTIKGNKVIIYSLNLKIMLKI
jgi:hypothetical protein